MKKITLLIALLTFASGFSQTNLLQDGDFENVVDGYLLSGTPVSGTSWYSTKTRFPG